jgi:hypothetical protein
MNKLGKIEIVDLRKVWRNEARDFTTWLASEENIDQLNEITGLNLVNIKTEVSVGQFKCDIVCEDDSSKTIVIIENQLEYTDHDHLGKLITYASGLDAKTIIWIVKEARPEHSSAIEWLNNVTNNEISFYLIQIEAIKIGNSDPAINYKIVEEPNQYTKSVNFKELNENQKNKLDFWTQFNVVSEERKEFNLRKPAPDHWMNFSIGSSDCSLSADLLNDENFIRINMSIPDNKELFDEFLKNKEMIENIVGEKLNWDKKEGRKSSSIYTTIVGFSFKEKDKYNELSNKIIDKLVLFRKAFKQFI